MNDNFEKYAPFMTVHVFNLKELEEKQPLENLLYFSIGDIAVAACLELEAEKEHVIKVGPITKEFAEACEGGVFRVINTAMQNMLNKKPLAYNLAALLELKPLYFMNPRFKFSKEDLDKTCFGLAVTNSSFCGGASTIFAPGVAKRLSELLDDDLYLVFTSHHEVIIHRVSDTDVGMIQEALRDMGKQFTSEKITDFVYCYHRDGEYFSVVWYVEGSDDNE